jgi:hypothetical protein
MSVRVGAKQLIHGLRMACAADQQRVPPLTNVPHQALDYGTPSDWYVQPEAYRAKPAVWA